MSFDNGAMTVDALHQVVRELQAIKELLYDIKRGLKLEEPTPKPYSSRLSGLGTGRRGIY